MKASWIRALLVLVPAVAVGVQACGPGCYPAEHRDIAVPDGELTEPIVSLARRVTGDVLFEGVFPSGLFWTPDGEATGEGGSAGEMSVAPPTPEAGGEVVYSGSLVVDRAAGIVTRRYIDRQGRTVVERWRMALELAQ